ncbi:MAG: DUF4956 domain-containing protein [Candidatus Pacebacteria bacterium]|nr:DUF4956 domain-containing protein [Candidatus Paceibacterota bacterium]
MTKYDAITNFLTTQSTQISITGFVVGLILTAVLSFALGFIYIRYGRSISNKRAFAKNFILVAMTTMFIITVVKVSLALSLGLVGALSIIRFRTAIKEPEELAYLFLAISIGLGFGAGQILITLIAFLAIVLVIFITAFSYKKEKNQNLYLTISAENLINVSLEKIVEILKKYCSGVVLKRFDETKEILEASFLVEFANFEQLNKSKAELRGLDDSLKINFLDNKGVQ